jgi:hypothetical protein
MTMTRPVLLLDIDGVLLPYGDRDGPQVGGYRFGESHIPAPFGGTTQIRWSPAMVSEFAGLDVEIRWCSSWCTQPPEFDPNRLLGPLFGWPALDISTPTDGFRPSDLHTGDQGWKRHAALSVVDTEGRLLIWLDDCAAGILDIRRRGRRHRAVRQLAAQPHLVIAPDPHIGLTRADLRAVRRFVTDERRTI